MDVLGSSFGSLSLLGLLRPQLMFASVHDFDRFQVITGGLEKDKYTNLAFTVIKNISWIN